MATITFNEVPANAAASLVAVEQEAVSRGLGVGALPRKILVVGQYNSGKSPTNNVPQLILNEADSWDRYGRGSLLARMIRRVLDNTAGIVPVYALPLADDGSGVAATGTLAFTGTATAAGTVALDIAGRRITATVAIDDTATEVGDAVEAAINADLDLPVTAANVTGTVTLTVRWAGASGNQITVTSNPLDTDATPAGIALTVTDVGDEVAGANDPDATTALAALGDTWYTDVAYPYLGDTEIDVLEAAGDTRADAAVMRMFAAFLGYTDTSANLITALDDRNSQWTTIVPVHGSVSPAYEIAGAAAGRFARVQEANPGRPVKNQLLTGIAAGGTNNDLTYSTRDTVVKAGGSHTYDTSDGRVIVGDLVTTRTTTDAGADTSDWRFTIIIANLQYKVYQTEQTFRSTPFDQGIVAADGDPPGPTYVIRPSTVKAYAVQLVDNWVSLGLTTDRDTVVAGITATIDSVNSGRINLLIPDIVTLGLRILAAKIEWAPLSG